MATNPISFEFTSYRFEPREKRIFFNYQARFRNGASDLFTETITLPKAFNPKELPVGLFEKILQDIHLALGISYYKLHCARKIKMNHFLTKEEADFWTSFYTKGLGEFFYRNKLDPAIFPGFKFDRKKTSQNYRLERNDKFLVAVSGGKDSIVAVELLKEYGADFSDFFVEIQKTSPLVDKVMEKMNDRSFTIERGGKSFKVETEIRSFKIRRNLDEKIFNEEAGYYSGHIPVSGIYAFLGILSAVIYNHSYFVVSNEFSSNFGNVKYKGKTINHQWSKSFEFENLLQDYVRKFISPDILYFSLMRPFYEIRIAELFVKHKEYFPYFSSCNKNFKINHSGPESPQGKLWCGQCPKCVFVFLLFSPFLSKEQLISLFGENLFKDVTLLLTLRDILGFGKVKPFDCVGTFEEAKAALYMSKDKFRDDLAGEIFLPKIDPEDNRYFFNERKIPFKIYFQGKRKPKELIARVFRAQPSSVPDYLKFLGMNSVFLLGYGKEGEITKKYLDRNFPYLKIEIGDVKNNPDYLAEQKKYDIAVRSPGVPKESVKIPYTTATNIFFSYIRQMPQVKIIGVTGTKGKSTTASLIHHILKQAGKNAELLGNIGKPMLEALLKKIKKDTIFVLELSSYQLDDIKFSPDIAVLTSLFPEHMDYHRNIKNYYAAKKNIIKYQQKEDILVFDPKNKKMASWAKDTLAKKVPFATKIPLDDSEIQLQGKHNRENIKAAIAVAEALGVSEEIIKKAVKTFKGLPHRLEFVGEYSGIKFYDDAISTTPESTILAIKSLPKIGTIFLGGRDRGYSFSKLAETVKARKIKNIVLFPDSGRRIIKSMKGINILETSSMEEAVRFAYKHTGGGEACLLSCASPSYSLWKNFEEKGDQFKFWVKYISEKDEKKI